MDYIEKIVVSINGEDPVSLKEANEALGGESTVESLLEQQNLHNLSKEKSILQQIKEAQESIPGIKEFVLHVCSPKEPEEQPLIDMPVTGRIKVKFRRSTPLEPIFPEDDEGNL